MGGKKMKRIRLFNIFIFMCLNTIAHGQSEKVFHKPNDDALLYYYIDPMVVRKDDASTTLTVEVTTSGEDITRVYLDDPDETHLVDDGTNGDRVAGDGIYTATNVPTNTDDMTLVFGSYYSRGPDVFVEKTGGSTESDYLRFGVVASGVNYPAVQLGEGLSATQYAFFIEDPEGVVLETPNWPLGNVRCGKENFEAAKKLYSVLPDNFDFIIVMPAHTIFKPDIYGENTPYFVRAKNDIQNIGIDLFDDTADFGSDGRLKGMIYHSWGYGSILDHEIGHSWCADIGESLTLCRCENSYGNHWNPLSDIGGQMNAFLFHPDVTGHLKNNGDGTWRIERDPSNNSLYSELDLYVMGLIPSSEVQPVNILVNPDLTDHLNVVPESVITYTIQDIMDAEGGERIPSYADSQKEFNVAFVVVKNKAFTSEEYAYYSLLSQYFASTEQGELSLTTFYHATGGRGTLNPDLGVDTVVESKDTKVSGYLLNQNYPNPFNHSTNITFTIPRPGHVTLNVYDLTGRKLSTLVNGYQDVGYHQVNWNAADVASGIYLVKIKTDQFTQTRKLILQK